MTPSDLIKQALTNLVRNSKGQYISNVIDFCKKEHGWNDEECAENIRVAIEEGVVVEKMHAGRDSLRIVNVEGTEGVEVYISDNSDNASTDATHTEALPQPTYDDFISFKRHISQVTSNISTSVNDTLSNFEGRLDNIAMQIAQVHSPAVSRFDSMPTHRTTHRTVISQSTH